MSWQLEEGVMFRRFLPSVEMTGLVELAEVVEIIGVVEMTGVVEIGRGSRNQMDTQNYR